MFRGYKEAQRIDRVITRLLVNYPITKTNALEWLNCLRNVQSTCNLLINVATKILEKGT